MKKVNFIQLPSFVTGVLTASFAAAVTMAAIQLYKIKNEEIVCDGSNDDHIVLYLKTRGWNDRVDVARVSKMSLEDSKPHKTWPPKAKQQQDEIEYLEAYAAINTATRLTQNAAVLGVMQVKQSNGTCRLIFSDGQQDFFIDSTRSLQLPF